MLAQALLVNPDNDLLGRLGWIRSWCNVKAMVAEEETHWNAGQIDNCYRAGAMQHQ